MANEQDPCGPDAITLLQHQSHGECWQDGGSKALKKKKRSGGKKGVGDRNKGMSHRREVKQQSSYDMERLI